MADGWKSFIREDTLLNITLAKTFTFSDAITSVVTDNVCAFVVYFESPHVEPNWLDGIMPAQPSYHP